MTEFSIFLDKFKQIKFNKHITTGNDESVSYNGSNDPRQSASFRNNVGISSEVLQQLQTTTFIDSTADITSRCTHNLTVSYSLG